MATSKRMQLGELVSWWEQKGAGPLFAWCTALGAAFSLPLLFPP